MTLDETIKEAKTTAVVYEKEAHKYTQHGGSFYEEKAKVFSESAKEFTQIAEWLEELKAYREADRPQGEWYQIEDHKVMGEGYMWHCSLCDHRVYQDSSADYPTENFCPHCGARMKGAKR